MIYQFTNGDDWNLYVYGIYEGPELKDFDFHKAYMEYYNSNPYIKWCNDKSVGETRYFGYAQYIKEGNSKVKLPKEEEFIDTVLIPLGFKKLDYVSQAISTYRYA